MNKSFFTAARASLVAGIAMALVACGGGGSGGAANGNSRVGGGVAIDTNTNISSGSASGTGTGVGAGSGTGSGSGNSSSGIVQTKPLVPTLDPATTSPRLTSAVCATFNSNNINPVLSSDADVQAIYNALGNTDQSAYAAFIRAPDVFTYWTRSEATALVNMGGKNINFVTLGTGLHETLHTIDFALTYTCNSDGYRRFYVDGTVQVSGMRSGDTLPYGIIAETYPLALRTSRALRYDNYVVEIGNVAGNQFGILLDEFSAYTAGANLEFILLKSIDYSFLATSPTLQLAAPDVNSGGMVDFMLFIQSYLMAARLNHPATHNAIATQPATKAVLQMLWTKSETLLASLYPYSVKSGGNRLVIPPDAIAQIYSAPFLQELDILGITHKTAADFSNSYLKP